MQKILTIVFSNRCNLDCSFCCVKDSLNKGEVIGAQEAFDFILWQVSLNTELSYLLEIFGGEPLVHYSSIKELFNLIETKSKECSKISPELSRALENLFYRIYTNGVYNDRIRQDRAFWSMFDEIILSVEGEYRDSKERHPNNHSYDVAINNYKDLLTYANVGIAFVLSNGTDVERIFKYFESMGTRYFTFEIMTLINDNKSGEISLQYLYRVFKCIYENILLHNLEEPDNYYLFSVPRELIAGYNFFTNNKRHSCLETMRSMSPKGNIYFCRDLAVSEVHLEDLSTDSDVFFSTKEIIKPFNIKDLRLDKDSDTYLKDLKKYDELTACPVKSFEFIHLAKGMDNPIWITDKDFQDLLIRPLFELMWNTFSLYTSEYKTDKNFKNMYKQRIKVFGKTLEVLKKTYEKG